MSTGLTEAQLSFGPQIGEGATCHAHPFSDVPHLCDPYTKVGILRVALLPVALHVRGRRVCMENRSWANEWPGLIANITASVQHVLIPLFSPQFASASLFGLGRSRLQLAPVVQGASSADDTNIPRPT